MTFYTLAVNFHAAQVFENNYVLTTYLLLLFAISFIQVLSLPTESELFILRVFFLCVNEISECFSSHEGPGGERYDIVSAVIQSGEEGTQPKGISEDKAGGCVTSEKITFITFTG